MNTGYTDALDLNEHDEDFLAKDPTPSVTVTTGLESWEGATHLAIFYHEGNTLVEHAGEEQNSEPVKFIGELTSKRVLAKYLKTMKEEDPSVT